MTFEVPSGAANVPVAVEPADTVVVLAHGAGSHMDHRTILWLSDLVRAAGAGVARFNFGYRTLGKSMPDRMPVLIETYSVVIDAIRREVQPKRLLIGGHSMGGRAASMLAAEQVAVDGLVLFAYPLHPPGKFEKLRAEHLPRIQCRALQINGTRDEFCRRDLMEQVPISGTHKIFWVEGADHSYSVSKGSRNTKKDAEGQIVDELSMFLKAK